MTLKELLELGIREGIIVEEQPNLAAPDDTSFRNFSAKMCFSFSQEELENIEGEKAEKLLMFRTSEAGGSVGCVVVWKSEGVMKLTNP